MNIHRKNILGTEVSAVNLVIAVKQISEWIATKQPNYVCLTPAHSIMESYHHPDVRLIFNCSGMTTPDGMAVVWLLRLLGQKNVSRVYGPDLTRSVCAESLSTGWKHFFYGGSIGVADKLAVELQSQYPGINIVGTYTPPFRNLTEDEDCRVVNMINASQADIVWVGISSPRQDIWMKDHLGQVNASALIGIGAAFDFLSGNKKQAPRWIQKSGFEWLFRLCSEPKRLWRRYAEYPLFILLVIAQLAHLKKFPTS